MPERRRASSSAARLLVVVASVAAVVGPSVVSVGVAQGAEVATSTVSASGVQLPACPAVTMTRSGAQRTGVHQGNGGGSWDLSGAVWSENAPDPIDYPIRSESWTKGCIQGGEVYGSIPKGWTRDQWYNGEDGGTEMHGEAFRVHLNDVPANFLRIDGAYVEDQEDAYNPRGATTSATTYLNRVRASYIRDDCIENEEVVQNVVLTDSLLDGCFTVFAERPSGASTAANGTGPASLTVQDSLIYVQPQPLGRNYCDDSRVAQGRCRPTADPDTWLGAYGIWKWSTAAARSVTVKNTVFRLDMPSYSSCSSQVWPQGTYENVTLVWTGAGPYRTAGGCTNVLPDGVTLTTDVSVWNDAKAAWLGSDTGSPTPAVQRGRVTQVVDGDTLEVRLSTGRVRQVRMVGLDAPELGAVIECGGRAALRSLSGLAPAGTRVTLVADGTQGRVDGAGRLLRYVTKRSTGADLNREQVWRGWAKGELLADTFELADSYSKAHVAAQAALRGIWKLCG